MNILSLLDSLKDVHNLVEICPIVYGSPAFNLAKYEIISKLHSRFSTKDELFYRDSVKILRLNFDTFQPKLKCGFLPPQGHGWPPNLPKLVSGLVRTLWVS